MATKLDYNVQFVCVCVCVCVCMRACVHVCVIIAVKKTKNYTEKPAEVTKFLEKSQSLHNSP